MASAGAAAERQAPPAPFHPIPGPPDVLQPARAPVRARAPAGFLRAEAQEPAEVEPGLPEAEAVLAEVAAECPSNPARELLPGRGPILPIQRRGVGFVGKVIWWASVEDNRRTAGLVSS